MAAANQKKSRQQRRREKQLQKKQNGTPFAANRPVMNPVDIELRKRLKQIEALRKSGEVSAALQSAQQLLSAHPKRGEVVFAVGALNLELERNDLAYRFLKRAVELMPDRGDYWLRLAASLHALGEGEAARIAAMNAVQRIPTDHNALYFLGTICRDVDDADNALKAFNALLSLNPNDAKAMFGKARTLMVLGDIEGAETVLLELLDKYPNHFRAYQNLIKNKSKKVDSNNLRKFALKCIEEGNADKENLITAYFSLAYLEDKEKNFDKAFEYFSKANEIQFQRRPFSKKSFKHKIDRLIDGFSVEAIEALSAGGSQSRTPIFIVGMPRSGTTLTEQILSSHSKVHGAGELRKVSNIVHAMCGISLQGFTYPTDMARFDPNALADLGDQYLDVAMRHAADGAERVVDKMPGNIIHLGLIGAMFPNATLVHCMRDPMDTAISCFTQNFKDELSYTCDLSSLGLYYRETIRLMDHWKAIFPDRILEVRYEETIADQETMSRKLIAHAGLEWEDQCLNFHETERSVQTASLWQVRQPIYKTSVQRWRRYEKHLGPLIEALEEHKPELAE